MFVPLDVAAFEGQAAVPRADEGALEAVIVESGGVAHELRHVEMGVAPAVVGAPRCHDFHAVTQHLPVGGPALDRVEGARGGGYLGTRDVLGRAGDDVDDPEEGVVAVQR